MTFNPMDMTGRAVLVTGASSGLGRAAAIALSRLGARVFLLARDEVRLCETLAALEGDGHGHLSFDLNSVDDIPKVMADIAGRFSPLSGIAHFAGLMQTKPLQASKPADYESLYRVNVIAGMQLLRSCAARGIVTDAGAAVVLVGSVMSLVASPGQGAYAASKAAVLGLVRTSALELARFRVRVNAVLPAHVSTQGADTSNHHLTPEQMEQFERKHPLGFGRPEDVANAAAFLLSDASRWITGSALTVDGGYTAQ
ncbi:MAG: SDR family oxidoreductase [Planctomycetaceae bacterium]|nr:SDR family oxidoreductase [Planctomycetaceae bacterium]